MVRLVLVVVGSLSACRGSSSQQPDAAPAQDVAIEVDAPRALFSSEVYLKPSNAGGAFGCCDGVSLALSADGATLAVAASAEASAATGIDGDQTDTSAAGSGAVYLFTRAGTTWTQQAYIKASNTDAGDRFGSSVALSADGNTLAVGALHEASAAKGIDGNQADNTASQSGAAYVFVRSGTSWSQQAYVKASNTDAGDLFGVSVALSADGNTLGVGAAGEASAGGETDNSASLSGAAYVFVRSGATWSQQAYVKASNPDANDIFGVALGMSADGNTLAAGAWGEASAATGIDGNQADNTVPNAGAVYLFTRSGTAWAQAAYVKASNSNADDIFGYSTSLSADGTTLAVGAYQESSAAVGVGGNQGDNSAPQSGAVYVFALTGHAWSQQAYVKASNADPGDQFGYSVALSGDGNVLVAGALLEYGAATGIDGDPSSNATSEAGAGYVFSRTNGTWTPRAYVKGLQTHIGDWLGGSVAVSADGATLAIGSRDIGASGGGAVYVLR